jgi:hypothetical protein
VDFQGKVAVVSGGASGIGAGLVQTLTEAGATVVIAASNNVMDETVMRLHGADLAGKSKAWPCARSSAAKNCQRFGRRIVDHFGKRMDWASRPSSELRDHREIVADRPTLGNPPANEPVGEHRVSAVAAWREVESAEGATGPVVLSRTELHHQVVLGHDFRPKPPSGVEVTPSALQELTGPSYALGPARRQGVVDDVRSAEEVESAEVAPAVPEVVDLLNDCLVVI